MTKHESNYRSFLLRLWRQEKKDAPWRVMLQDVQTGEQRYFASLKDAFRFLDGATSPTETSAEQ